MHSGLASYLLPQSAPLLPFNVRVPPPLPPPTLPLVCHLTAFCTAHAVLPTLNCRYGGEHKAPELQKEVVYGLTELHREAVK